MKVLILCCAVFIATSVSAQKANPTATAKKPPVFKPPVLKKPVSYLKNQADSASYAIGLSVANFYKQQGITKLNSAAIAKAVEDIMSSKKPLLDDMQANNCIMTYMNSVQETKSKPVIVSGEKFLEANKKKAGVITTSSGLQYEVLRSGTGVKPEASDSVVAHYAGTLLDGSEVDNSYKRGEPITFAVGGVIRGWTEALLLMNEGSKWKLYIPHTIGYGTQDYGPIPGGSVLVFEIELLKVIKGK